MCSLKYIVLALFLDAVASSPYYIPGSNINYKPEAALYTNAEYESPRSDERAYLPRSLPSYMSPLPTKKDSGLNEDSIRQHNNNIRGARSPNYIANAGENSGINDEEQFTQIQSNVALSTSHYANPSTLSGNELLSHLLRQNQPVVNNFVEPAAFPNNKELRNQVYGEKYNQNPFHNSNYEQPLRIQAAPEQRIAFQAPVSHNLPNLDSYHPAIPVRDFNVGREWSRIANAPPKLPDFISERLRHPVDVQRSPVDVGQQVQRPSNAELVGNGQKYDIQKILSDQRLRHVLSSTKQTKRYLVIHPNGTVEHVDNLEPIASRNPNYVLVNAGHLVPNNGEPEVKINESNVQVPAPTLEPISSSKVPVISEPQIEPFVESDEKVEVTPKKIDEQTITPQTSTVVEVTPSSESSITTELEIVSSSTLVTDISPSTTVEPKTAPESSEISEHQEHKAPENIQNNDSAEESTVLENGFEHSEADEETDSNTASEGKSSLSTTDIQTTTEDVNATQENAPVVSSTATDEAANIAEDAPSVSNENITKDESHLTVEPIHNVENAEDVQTDKVNALDYAVSRRVGKPMVYNTSDPDFWEKVTDGKPDNFIYFFQFKPSPRIEKDTERTIYPDGTILEVLTETVWEEEGAEPKITKSSKLIHPEDL